MTLDTSGSDRRTVTATDIEDILVSRCGADRDSFAGREHFPLAELDIDSLAVLELQAVVAARFGVEIPEDGQAMSVRELAAFVADRVDGGR
jgi:acyl carrier protein